MALFVRYWRIRQLVISWYFSSRTALAAFRLQGRGRVRVLVCSELVGRRERAEDRYWR